MVDCEIPSWLDENFVVQVIHSAEGAKRKVKIVSFQCQPAVGPGSNYLSSVYRVQVEFEVDRNRRTDSFIIKTPTDCNVWRDFTESFDGYSKELKIYNTILPMMYNTHHSRVSPRSYSCPVADTIVLQDLRVDGYVMEDRLKRLDFHHCRLVLESVAKFHAMSVKIHSENPIIIENMNQNMFYNDQLPIDKQTQFKNMITLQLNAMIDTIAKLDDGSSKYASMIQNKTDGYWERMVKLLKPGKGFDVLNHGDVWTTNIVFKHLDFKVVDAKLLDFQMSFYCSFTYDLIYFWFSSANEDVLENNKEELFEVYRQTLNSTLAELGCIGSLSKEDFGKQLKATAPLCISVLATICSFSMADPDNLVEFSNDSQEHNNDLGTKNCRSKYYKALLPKMLSQAETFGAFE